MRHPRIAIGLLAAIMAAPLADSLLGKPAEPATTAEQFRLERLLSELKDRLGLQQQVQILIVAHNHRVISVERNARNDETYSVIVDQEFLEGLNEDDINAAIAHELGHVWLYCNHPYLQTEMLANEIALKVVSRDKLRTLYAKLERHTGTPVDLTAVLPAE